MLHLSVNKIIKQIPADKTFILTDFDYTLTKKDSKTIWGIISDNPYVDPMYDIECMKNYNYYRKIELDPKISTNDKKVYMDEWVNKHIELFKKYHISLDTLNKIVLNENDIFLRDDVYEFLYEMHHLNIPVYIISSGFTNLIKLYLEKNNCYFDNINIIANSFLIDNNIISGIKKPYINSANKEDIDLSFINRTYGISFGDQLEDLNVGKNMNITHVAFLNDHEASLSSFLFNFDVLLTGDTSFKETAKLLIKK